MTRSILTYGLISGLIIILGMIGTILTPKDSPLHGSLLVGYLIMLVGLSSVLVGVKQYRDQTLGGVIRFWPALGMGLGIALVASFAYVAIWEVYMAMTHYTFMDRYAEDMLAAKRAAGVTGEAYARAVEQARSMREQYANPMIRMFMTFTEIFPVGLVVAVVCAALLRNPKFLPARSRAAAA